MVNIWSIMVYGFPARHGGTQKSLVIENPTQKWMMTGWRGVPLFWETTNWVFEGQNWERNGKFRRNNQQSWMNNGWYGYRMSWFPIGKSWQSIYSSTFDFGRNQRPLPYIYKHVSRHLPQHWAPKSSEIHVLIILATCSKLLFQLGDHRKITSPTIYSP